MLAGYTIQQSYGLLQTGPIAPVVGPLAPTACPLAPTACSLVRNARPLAPTRMSPPIHVHEPALSLRGSRILAKDSPLFICYVIIPA